MTEVLDYVVYHLKQIGLEKQLYGGIILTGGGAQLKNIIQLTEYITGLGCRLGFSNEHLAGDHPETLSNPMYATCIGLILRGYHDFENGRLRFVGDGGNVIHLTEEDLKPVITEETLMSEPAAEAITTQEDEVTAVTRKTRKRTVNMHKIFDQFKDKFMGLFEDVEDKEI
jgi:cell division protein FtsA